MPTFIEETEYAMATGMRAPQPPAHPTVVPPVSPEGQLQVLITHEFFEDGFVLSWDGKSEQFSHVEALAWFLAHGAKNQDNIHLAINCAQNLGSATLTIHNPIRSPERRNPIDPVI
jgi:hypothetical protein